MWVHRYEIAPTIAREINRVTHEAPPGVSEAVLDYWFPLGNHDFIPMSPKELSRVFDRMPESSCLVVLEFADDSLGVLTFPRKGSQSAEVETLNVRLQKINAADVPFPKEGV
jgi:hypothetical protein